MKNLKTIGNIILLLAIVTGPIALIAYVWTKEELFWNIGMSYCIGYMSMMFVLLLGIMLDKN